MKRRLVLAAPVALVTNAFAAGPHHLPIAKSLTDELAAALQAKAPLLVMVSFDGCVHCATVRDHHLAPLHAESRQPMVQVDMRSGRHLLDFTGQSRTHDQVVRSWGVDAAPTLLFFGQQGREIAPRLRGVSIPDFYGAYLQDRIQVARRELSR